MAGKPRLRPHWHLWVSFWREALESHRVLPGCAALPSTLQPLEHLGAPCNLGFLSLERLCCLPQPAELKRQALLWGASRAGLGTVLPTPRLSANSRPQSPPL